MAALFSRAYAGERIFGSGVPIGGEDMYILGSSGKSMTSTMAARVVAKGYISWKTTTKEIFQDTVCISKHPKGRFEGAFPLSKAAKNL